MITEDITEDYVGFKVAKLLKEKGFEEWCFKCYGVAVLHNGVDISFDEECDLKDEGRENEIEYVEGGRLYDYACNNREKVRAVWAAPTLWAAMKWLMKIHNLHCAVDYDFVLGWYCQITSLKETVEYDYEEMKHYHPEKDNGFSSPEEACEEAIKYCLEKLI